MRLAPWSLLAVCICAIAAAILFVGQVHASDPKFPQLTDRVVDESGILSPQTRDQITQMLAQHEQSTGDQIVVVTVKSLQGYPIEDFGYKLGRQWGIGQKERNNGALLLIAPNERKVRIEVGYGLEDRLTDAQDDVIIEQNILPAFRSGDFNKGVQSGAAAMLRVLGGEHLADESTTQAPAKHNSTNFAIWDLLFLLMIWSVILLSYWWHRNDPHVRRSHGLYLGAGGLGLGGMSGGDSFGGGFLGGGGSFGGGGATGSW